MAPAAAQQSAGEREICCATARCRSTADAMRIELLPARTSGGKSKKPARRNAKGPTKITATEADDLRSKDAQGGFYRRRSCEGSGVQRQLRQADGFQARHKAAPRARSHHPAQNFSRRRNLRHRPQRVPAEKMAARAAADCSVAIAEGHVIIIQDKTGCRRPGAPAQRRQIDRAQITTPTPATSC